MKLDIRHTERCAVNYIPTADCNCGAEAQAKLTSKQYIPDDWGIVGINFWLYPGGVECVVTQNTMAGLDESKSFVKAGMDNVESYNRQLFAAEAFSQALKQLTGEPK